VTSAFRQSYFPPAALDTHGVALASARAGNAIGGGDWTADQLVPDLMRSFAAGRPCPIRSPHAIRPWQFVLEPLRGYLMLAQRLFQDGRAFATGWNFGPVSADARPVSWIADRLAATWGDGASWAVDHGAHPAEAAILTLDASQAGACLGWQPALPLAQALDWIAEWYRGWLRGADLGHLTRSHIARYHQLIEATA
jgi:CDP-glucose 4,6-dehydratase